MVVMEGDGVGVVVGMTGRRLAPFRKGGFLVGCQDPFVEDTATRRDNLSHVKHKHLSKAIGGIPLFLQDEATEGYIPIN